MLDFLILKKKIGGKNCVIRTCYRNSWHPLHSCNSNSRSYLLDNWLLWKKGRKKKLANQIKKKKKQKGLPQVEIPLKLGNCAELVGVAELVELVVPAVAEVVAFGDDALIPLAVDDADVEVDDASCDHTIEAKSWRMRNKGRGRCKNFIVLV